MIEIDRPVIAHHIQALVEESGDPGGSDATAWIDGWLKRLCRRFRVELLVTLCSRFIGAASVSCRSLAPSLARARSHE